MTQDHFGFFFEDFLFLVELPDLKVNFLKFFSNVLNVIFDHVALHGGLVIDFGHLLNYIILLLCWHKVTLFRGLSGWINLVQIIGFHIFVYLQNFIKKKVNFLLNLGILRYVIFDQNGINFAGDFFLFILNYNVLLIIIYLPWNSVKLKLKNLYWVYFQFILLILVKVKLIIANFLCLQIVFEVSVVLTSAHFDY